MVGYARVRKELIIVFISGFDLLVPLDGEGRNMWLYLPDGIGVFGGLAVVEAQLFEDFGEGVFA